MDAALRSFAMIGVKRTTIEQITEQSRCTVGSVYHLFRSKEGIADALLAEGTYDYLRMLLEAFEETADPERGVRAGVLQHLRWVAENRILARFLDEYRETVLHAITLPQLVKSRQDFERTVVDWARHRAADGGLEKLPDHVYEPLWLGPARSFTRSWLDKQGHADMQDARLELPDSAWHVLRAGASSRRWARASIGAGAPPARSRD